MKKHVINRFTVGLLGVLLLLLSSCDILEKPFQKKGIQFAASSANGGATATKALFGQDVGNYQMIDWEDGDQVRIAARYARAGNGDFAYNGPSEYDYTVGNITTEGHYSKGRFKEVNEGLFWNPDLQKQEDEFWSIYPSSAAGTLTGGAYYDGSFVGSIPAITPSYAPRPPLMVAHSVPSSNASGATITLYYVPGFTAFLFSMFNNADVPITVDGFSMSAPESAPALAGDYLAYISGIGEDAQVSIASVSNAVHEVYSDLSSLVIAPGATSSFYIFCLPQLISDVHLLCTYTVQGQSQVTKTMDLTDFTFAAGMQHRMNLVLNANSISLEVTTVMKIIMANAFPDLFIFGWETGQPELMYKDEYENYHHKVVPADVILQKALEVTSVTLSNDYGTEPVYTAQDMAAFPNLVSFSIDHVHTLSDLTIDGLPNFKELLMDKADALLHVSVSNCPIAETVVIDSQSLTTVNLENLTHLKNLKVNEANANSNLKSFSLKNCPDLVTAEFGLIGGLEDLDLHGCDKMETLTVGLAYVLKDVNLTGCSSLKRIYINKAQKLPSLDVSDCTNLESIEIVDAQELSELVVKNKENLTTINITSSTQALKKVELVNLPNLSSVSIPTAGVTEMTLSNLPSGINSIETFFPNLYGSMTCTELAVLSIDHCDGFTNIDLNPARKIAEMHFDSCANLASVTVHECQEQTNVYNPPYTSSIVATKTNCPNLNDYYTVNNGGRVVNFDFN